VFPQKRECPRVAKGSFLYIHPYCGQLGIERIGGFILFVGFTPLYGKEQTGKEVAFLGTLSTNHYGTQAPVS
jgi:hypothetical protein